MSVEVVATVKADLEARGVSLVGTCGAFAITRRVAWALRETGIGLIKKFAGQTHCEGYAVDALCWPDGRWVDLLINAGTENRPAWQYHEGTEARYPRVDPALWAAPGDPGDEPVLPTDPLPPPPDGLAAVLRELGAIRAAVDALHATVKTALP